MDDLAPILVAEDTDEDFFFLRRAFRAAAIENPLLRFRDGSELVRFLETLPAQNIKPATTEPWLVLLDITMPLMNGFEVLQWMAGREASPKLRAVVVSGSYRQEDIDRAKTLGASDYVVKPISAATLAILARPAATAGQK